jgi:hypothetical protein
LFKRGLIKNECREWQKMKFNAADINTLLNKKQFYVPGYHLSHCCITIILAIMIKCTNFAAHLLVAALLSYYWMHGFTFMMAHNGCT